MKRILFLAAFALTAFNSCHQKTAVEANPVPVTEAKGETIQLADLATDKDLVCGMVLEGQSIADTALYEGKMYGFCASECKAEFLKNPQSYLTH
ncbi:MAG: YHS domain-containing protein [Bacteroidota bacterium]